MSGSKKNIADVDEARLSDITTGPLPGSRKVYAEGVIHKSIRVPLREIAQTPTREHGGHREGQVTPNPPVHVYDTSGVYSDPDVVVDPREGLPAPRVEWVKAREDVEELARRRDGSFSSQSSARARTSWKGALIRDRANVVLTKWGG